MADNRNHDLFKTYPLVGRVRTSLGMLPTPYHVYDGKVSFLGGTASLEAVTDLLQSERVHPIQTSKGRALMGMWICEFNDASLGAHNELQFSFFVSEEKISPVQNHPLILLRELVLNPHIRMLVHGLWNSSETVVAYNTEILGLGARVSRGGAEFTSKSVKFLFNDYAQGTLIASGGVSLASGTSFGITSDLFRLLGFGGMMRFNTQPFIHTQAMNRVTKVIATNASSQTYTSASKIILQHYDSKQDNLIINQQPYAALEFRPKFIEHMLGFKFVYLNQHNRVDELLR